MSLTLNVQELSILNSQSLQLDAVRRENASLKSTNAEQQRKILSLTDTNDSLTGTNAEQQRKILSLTDTNADQRREIISLHQDLHNANVENSDYNIRLITSIVTNCNTQRSRFLRRNRIRRFRIRRSRIRRSRIRRSHFSNSLGFGGPIFGGTGFGGGGNS